MFLWWYRSSMETVYRKQRNKQKITMLGPEESTAVLVAKSMKYENSSVLLGYKCLDLY